MNKPYFLLLAVIFCNHQNAEAQNPLTSAQLQQKINAAFPILESERYAALTLLTAIKSTSGNWQSGF